MQRRIPHVGSNVPYAIELFDAGGNLVRRLTLTRNQVGSVVLVTDSATGDVVQRIEYVEFGRTVFDSSPELQPFGFGGGLLDGQTGLLRFGARDYSTVVGRWMTRDPVRFIGGPNAYLYAAADPTMRRDATGLKPPRKVPISPWDIGQLLCGFVTGGDCSLLPDWRDPEIYGYDGPAQCGLLEAAGYECCGSWDNVYACPPDNDTECDPRFQSCEPEDVQCGGDQSWSSW